MAQVRRASWLFGLVLVLDILVVTIAIGAINVDPDAASAAGRSHLKVAIIVGPVDDLTDDYRALANEAAEAARERTDRVVTVYSPDATWPAARAALTDASIVVYLGHGNGWPSPYRDQLFGRTQNGLGLNPVAGVDDTAHQYFGESYLSKVQLADGAVVILGHLCYASGNAEPGAAEPTVDVARQRVDNYAAGWMAAGATAVIAEGHGRPAYFVRSLLKGRGTIERMWQAGPTFHDHVLEFASERTSNAIVRIDPDGARTGFYRSLVVVPGARIADTLRAAATNAGAPAEPAPPTAPTPDPRALAERGARFGMPRLAGPPVVDIVATLTIPVDAATLGLLPDPVVIGTRWDAIPSDVRSMPLPSVEATSGDASAAPGPTSDRAVVTDAARPGGEAPSIDLIVPESTGKVVVTQPAIRTDAGLTAQVTTPTVPGLYRLVTTVHQADGVAYDAETQDLLGALIVRVTGTLWATYGLPTEASAVPDQPMTMQIRLANSGTDPWTMPWSDRSALLVARWVALDDITTLAAAPGETTVVAVVIAPAEDKVLQVELRAPHQPGSYLLVFDVQDGDARSLASIGVPPGLLRVTVQPVSATDGATDAGP